MNDLIADISMIRKTERFIRAFRMHRKVQSARDLMVAGEYEQALEKFKDADRLGIGFTPRATLLFAHCLSVLGMFAQAYSAAEIVEDTLAENSRRFNPDEVAYMVAFSRLIRNQCIENSEDLNAPRMTVDYSLANLSRVSNDLLATFPLENHPDWDALGWKG